MRTRIVVSAIVENSKGEILMGKKPRGRGVYLDAWHIPGGGINEGEKLEIALRREILEETSLEIKNIEPVIFCDDVTDKIKDGVTEKIHMVFLDYRCKAVSDKFKENDDLEKMEWVPRNEIKNRKLTPPSVILFKHLGWI